MTNPQIEPVNEFPPTTAGDLWCAAGGLACLVFAVVAMVLGIG